MKQLILLSFFMLLLTCTGCGKETPVRQSDENNSENALDKSNVDEEMPLSRIGYINGIDIEICGQQFAFPCRFGEFGENFKLENGYYFEEQGYTSYQLCYQNEDIGTVYLAGEKKDDNSETMVVGYNISDDLETNQFLIDGLGYDSYNTYIEHFGEPSVQNEGYLEYESENTVLGILFDDDEEIDYPKLIILTFTDYIN